MAKLADLKRPEEEEYEMDDMGEDEEMDFDEEAEAAPADPLALLDELEATLPEEAMEHLDALREMAGGGEEEPMDEGEDELEPLDEEEDDFEM